ncbi:MAG: hypothetical protein ABJA10_06150 [Aestuariivirga sp.]
MIVKRKHSGSFAVIPNVTANDDQLSIDALGMLVFLLSKPNNWEVNIANLRKRFGIGRDRVYAILKQLETTGYVKKRQPKQGESKQFCAVEYIVFDTPEAAKSEELLEPLSENTEAGISTAYEEAASVFAVSGKHGHILKTESDKREAEQINSASSDAGASAPSVSAIVWKEGRELLQQSASQANPSIIGMWLKRTQTDNDKQTLLQVFRAARDVGSGDPVAYVTRVVNDKFPLPPDPKTFDGLTWARNIKAAIKTKAWAPQWGPLPGRKDCLIPLTLVTRDLLAALQIHEVAA